ncbi:MAG: M24 family metallopeptidase [Symbiobacteriia bacterium]
MRRVSGSYFTYRTGYGLGLDDHEEPYITGDSDVRLGAGMTFTVEPEIYLPGKGGIYGLAVQLDAQGQVNRSLHDPSGQVYNLSSAVLTAGA